MNKKLITLARELDFETEEEYFQYCIDTHINGQFSACVKLFMAMSYKDRKRFLLETLSLLDKFEIFKFYFELL